MAQTRQEPRSVRSLEVYQAALALVAAAAKLLPQLGRFDSALSSQMKRALPSVPLNLAEAMRRTGRDRAHLLTVAMGSASEVQAVVDVGSALEIVTAEQAAPVDELCDRVCAMLYRLRQRKA